jgi:hypothetical protein
MRSPLLPLLVLTSLLGLAPTKAEFLMMSAPEAPTHQEPKTPTPHPKFKRRPLRLHASVRELALSGFGDRIPLSFAVRQIVPANFQVAYTDGVRQDAPVDWEGGEPWHATLSDAVRPLGLIVTVSGPKVTIAAAPAP